MKKNMTLVHVIIGLAIMFGIRAIPEGTLPAVTPVGLEVLGIFIGTIYLWTTVDPILGSLLSVAMLGFSNYAPMNAVLQQCFGNPTVVQCLFLMIVMGGLTDRKLNAYIARFILTRKFAEGKPWVFTALMCYGSYIMAVFVGAFAPIFLFWPVLTNVYEQVGFDKKEAYPKLMTIMIVMGALIGFPVPSYMGNGLALLGNWRGIAANAVENGATINGMNIDSGKYFIACFILGAILVGALILLMKFVFRPNVKPLESVTVEMLARNPLPPMNFAQKTYSIFYVTFIASLLLPTLIKGVPFLEFLQANNYGIGVFACSVLLAIRFTDPQTGKEESVLPFNRVMAGGINWGTYFLIACAVLLGSVLTNESTGITAFLNTVLTPVFKGMSGTVFTIAILCAAVVLTNICNSLVIGMILQPVILSYCVASGANAAPIITLLIFTVLASACVTPAASPFAAMLFGNKEFLEGGDIYKNCSIMVVTMLVIIFVVGIPLISMFVG